MDLVLQHDFKIGTRRVNLELNVLNLFDDDVPTAVFPTKYRDRLTFTPPETFFNGFDTEGFMDAQPTRYRPDARYRQDSTFLGRRDIRLSAGIRF